MELETVKCSICHISQSKYTCPGCEMKTCSLKCYNLHKSQYECDGKVDSNKYIRRNELTNVDLNRDYNFLLNVDRKIQLSKEDIEQKNGKNILKRSRNDGHPNQKRFKNDDKRIKLTNKKFTNSPTYQVKRDNVLIIQIPQGMQRSISNKTGYDKKLNSFTWTIEWIVLDSIGKEIYKFISYKVKEGNVLKDSVPMNILKNHISNVSELKFYLQNVLNSEKLIKLNEAEAISVNLKDKVVLEFPTIFITTNDESIKFRISNENEAYDYNDSSDLSETSSDSESDSSDESSSDSSDDTDSGPEESSSKPILSKVDNQHSTNDPNEINVNFDDID